MAIVWKEKNTNDFYSKGVTRMFGENLVIKINIDLSEKYEHETILAHVYPLKVNPRKHNMIKYGTI